MSILQAGLAKLIDFTSEKSVSFKLRKKRAEKITVLIEECYNKYKKVDILDIGGTKIYWNILPKEYLLSRNVHITIINLPSRGFVGTEDDMFSVTHGDACKLVGFSDKFFHIAHSNSVIEHVGNWNKITDFSIEVKRVAEKYFLQTPNLYFPIEPHFVFPFFQWLPESIKKMLIRNFNLGWIKKANNDEEAKNKVNSIKLLSKTDLLKLFPEAEFFYEKFFVTTQVIN